MFDIIGDIHGCNTEFIQLTKEMGYIWEKNVPIHPEGRMLVFVGDLADRGPNSIEVMETVWRLVVEQNMAHYVPGNHCDKLYRFFLGRNVQITHGLETTVAEYENLSNDEQQLVRTHFMELYEQSSLYVQLDSGNLVVAHAGIKEDYIGKNSKKVKTFVLYGDITGEKHPDGSPVRRDWAQHYRGQAWIVYGHTPVKSPRKVNHTYNIDTGAVFGNKLTGLRYPDMKLYSVPSSMPYVPEKFRSFD
ncbi:bis(5'-nucleosyl)-tetraphosphatase PrpE [Bacillus solimangrovi]|uniref:Calcineurin-like phosphoesterase domain-containing protein n=1 Tax=Bacillus solimangrovi TaxID=1305675 RepID=A0A1E5LBZ6_9BACI|nr:bis(5'-nucleosyl)-tetraphosphatase PrpE [Bacillus solimangrovi]OEH91601.1 hypothetical protein BFG57_04300 [Bacillus solimangrovi]